MENLSKRVNDFERLVNCGKMLDTVEDLKNLQAERGVISERSRMINAMIDQVVNDLINMRETENGE